MSRWPVRVSDEFWIELRAIIPDRSVRDRFVALDLPEIKRVFSEHWDDGHLLPSRTDPSYRALVSVGRIAPIFSVFGRLLSDGVIELRQVSIDWHPPE